VIIDYITQAYDLVFPIHPRTTAKLESFGLIKHVKSNLRLHLTEPMDYFAFQKLTSDCKFVITDSGGIQEETTYRGVSCLTLRPNTERPVTVTEGTNELITFDLDPLRKAMDRINGGAFKPGRIPHLWNGHATERVFETLARV